MLKWFTLGEQNCFPVELGAGCPGRHIKNLGESGRNLGFEIVSMVHLKLTSVREEGCLNMIEQWPTRFVKWIE
jgi:hypothetical protein